MDRAGARRGGVGAARAAVAPRRRRRRARAGRPGRRRGGVDRRLGGRRRRPAPRAACPRRIVRRPVHVVGARPGRARLRAGDHAGGSNGGRLARGAWHRRAAPRRARPPGAWLRGRASADRRRDTTAGVDAPPAEPRAGRRHGPRRLDDRRLAGARAARVRLRRPGGDPAAGAAVRPSATSSASVARDTGRGIRAAARISRQPAAGDPPRDHQVERTDRVVVRGGGELSRCAVDGHRPHDQHGDRRLVAKSTRSSWRIWAPRRSPSACSPRAGPPRSSRRAGGCRRRSTRTRTTAALSSPVIPRALPGPVPGGPSSCAATVPREG